MTHEELESYINGFRENVREVVYKQIIDSDILQKAFSTTEGKAILNNIVDIINGNILKILNICLDEPGEAAKKIYPRAAEVNLAYKVLTGWAKILIRGNEHKEKIERKEK